MAEQLRQWYMDELERLKHEETPQVQASIRHSPSFRCEHPPAPVHLTNRGPCQQTRMPVELPRYGGLTPLEPYLDLLEMAAHHGGWSDEQTTLPLVLALEGAAACVLLDLGALTAALNQRFGQKTLVEFDLEQRAKRCRRKGESLGAFTADVHRYARGGIGG